jgi:hypothetical protein
VLSRRLIRSLALTAVALLAGAAPAHADVTITSMRAGPAPAFSLPSGLPITPGDPSATANDLECSAATSPSFALASQAGATTDYCIGAGFAAQDPETGDDPRGFIVDLPAGSTGTFDLQTTCSPEAFGRERFEPQTCPAASQVGTTSLRLQLPGGGEQLLGGRLFALTPEGGRRGMLGAAVIASPDGSVELKYAIGVAASIEPDGHDVWTTDDLPRGVPTQAGPQPFAILGTAWRLWGLAAAHRHGTGPTTMAADFFAVGRRCSTDQTTRFGAVPASGALTTIVMSTYALTGCEVFPPELLGLRGGASSSRTSFSRKELPPVVPYFGTRELRGGGRLGTLVTVQFSGLPRGTKLVLRCTAACSRGRTTTIKVGRGGIVKRTLPAGWLIRPASRYELKATADGYATATARYRFNRRPAGIIAKTLD